MFIPNHYYDEQIYPLCSLLSVLPLNVKSYNDILNNKELIIKNNKGKAGIYKRPHEESDKINVDSAIYLSKQLYLYYLLLFLNHYKNSHIYSAIFLYNHSSFNLAILEYIDIPNFSKEEARLLILGGEQHYINSLGLEYKSYSWDSFRVTVY